MNDMHAEVFGGELYRPPLYIIAFEMDPETRWTDGWRQGWVNG